MGTAISVVIPTYNRPDQLKRVLETMLESDVDEFDEVEIIVVDDGSPQPVGEVVDGIPVAPPFSLRCIRQENAGPAEARNNGFQNASNEIVLFIDDDILVFPDLIQAHAAAHRARPGSVIFGQSPYAEADKSTPAYRYLNQLIDTGHESIGAERNEKFVRVEIVASGNLSVEKQLFQDRAVYAPGLQIPVGEEYELSAYLKERDIPIYFCPDIKGWHLQKATIEDTCVQNYKYGLGIAELAVKRPDVLERLTQPRTIFETNRAVQSADPVDIKLKKTIRRLTTSESVRKLLLAATKMAERSVQSDALLFKGYRVAIGTYFAAGIRDGIARFGKENR